MARKNVAIRLVAEGGRRVRAELEGVGDAGEQSFQRIDARAKAMGRSVKLAMAAAVTAAAAAGAAMVRSGMRTIQSQADVAQSLNTTVASMQVLHHAADLVGSSVGEVEGGVRRLTRRLSLFAKDGGGPAAKAIEQLNLNVGELIAMPADQRLAVINSALDRYATEAERAALLSQLFGDNSWMAFSRLDTATLEKATKDLEAFGVIVSDQDAAKIARTNEAISRMGLIWRGVSNQLAVAVAPALEAVASAIGAIASRSGPLGVAIQMVFENIGRLASTAAAFAAFMAGRWVASLRLATLATRTLSGALVGLSAAIARTGIGALVVLAGELIFQLTRLVASVGSVGKSFSLLWDIGKAVFAELGKSAQAMGAVMQAVAWGMARHFVDAFAWISRQWDNLVNLMLAPFNELMALMGSEFRLVANIGIGDILDEASARLGELAEGHVEAAREIYDGMELTKASVEALLAAMADPSIDIDAATRLPLDLADALAGPGGAGGRAASAAATSEERDAAAELIGSLRQELTVLRELDPVKRRMLEYSDQLADATGRQRDEVRELVEALREEEHGFTAVTRKLAEYADEAGRIGSDIGDALTGAFGRAEDAVAQFVKTGSLNFSDLVSSIISDLARLSTRHFITGPLSGLLGDSLGGGGIFANLFHSGGLVGAGGPGRMVSAATFANAPRMHGGGIAGLRSDEVPAILQRGERVLSRRETSGYGAVTVNIQTRDAESFRQSRSQITADIARAVNLGRRGM